VGLSRARSCQHTSGALIAVVLLAGPALLAAAPAAGAPVPQAVGQRIVFFEDFSSGALDPERWVLPAAWGLERARMKPWDFPALPLNDTQAPHLSDSPYDLGGRYLEASRTWVESNWVDLSSAPSTAQLSLFHRYDIDGAEDAAFVMARSELRGWAVIAPVAGYPTLNGFGGSSLVFTGTTFDLSAYVGSRVKVAFEIVSGTNGVTGDGWQLQSLQVAYSTSEALPDFAASELQLYDDSGGRIFSGTAGQLIELRLVVSNPGTATPPRVAPVVFYDGPQGSGRLLGRADLLPVAPGTSGTASLFTVLGPGAHTLTAVVDPAGGTEELSRSNNVASTTVNLDPPSGVDLVPLEFLIEAGGVPTTGARPGDGLTANITVANLGSAGVTTPYTVGLYLRQSPNATVLLQDQTSSVGIGPGESRTVQIPFTAVAGDLTLVAEVDSQGDVGELSETNNGLERRFPVSNSPGVDLELAAAQVLRGGLPSSDAVEGELLQVSATVRNGGAADITEPFTVSAYLGDPDAGGTPVYARRVAGGLLANQTIEVAGSWVAQVGVRVLYVYADVGREVFESSEVNNKASYTVSVRADTRVNLAVTDVEFKVFGREVEETQVGAPVNITVTVSNLGVETDVDGFLSLSPENPWVFLTTSPLEARRLPAVIPRSGQVELTFPWTAVSGSHVFFFVADYALTVSETSEFDNLAVRTLVVSPESADLAVGSVSVRSRNVEANTLYPQLNVTIRSEVTNAGIKSVDDPFQVEVWAGQPGELGSVRLHRLTVAPPFVVGDSVEVEVQWFVTFPSGGQHAIVVTADADGSIVEADRTNNVGVKDVTYAASALPNLQVESVMAFRAGASIVEAKDGEALEVRVAVVNTSPVPFTAGSVLEARDGTSLIFSAPVTRMDPGDRVEFSFNWTAAAAAQVRVSVNLLGEAQEADFADNALDLRVLVRKPVETPWTLYGGAGVAAAGVAAVALLLLVRRRRSRTAEAAEGGAGAAGAEPGTAPGGADDRATEPARGAAAAAVVVAPPAAESTDASGEAAAAAPTACPACHEPVEPGWKVCPTCETPLG